MHVSVMVPAAGRAALLRETVASVLDQEGADFDLAVVDDASVEDLPAALGTLGRDARLRFHRNPSPLGLAGNWNRCLELARGPAVMVLGSDDLLEPGGLRAVSAAFDEVPSVGLVHGRVRWIDGHGQSLGAQPAGPPLVWPAGDEAVSRLLTAGICASATVVRRACYEALGGYDATLWSGPDIEFAARIARGYDVCDTGTVTVSFRRHAANAGVFFYTRPDLMDAHLLGLRRAWSHLSPEGRARLGILDLDRHLGRLAAEYALGGSVTMTGAGDGVAAARYLRCARELDPSCRRRPRYWRAWALQAVPALGRLLVSARLSPHRVDRGDA
jgi:glycosyltransferase involved in cell wall biosynthesis